MVYIVDFKTVLKKQIRERFFYKVKNIKKNNYDKRETREYGNVQARI